jgi:enoyl-CoA hydratase/carnithine racemase
MTAPAEDIVLFELLTPHIALVTLNRPAKRNAISPEVAIAMDAIVKKIENDSNIRVAILTSSEPNVFCAGADLAAVAEGRGAGMETPGGGFGGFVYAQRMTPWIAAVEGLALAGGFEMCLACDMIVASQNARFGLPEVKRGMMAGAGGLPRIAQLLPRTIAAELIATGEPMEAQLAFQHGLINRIVAPGQALRTAQNLAKTIAVNAPLAVQQSLAAMRASIGQSDGTARDIVSDRNAMLRRTDDFKEGPRAFLEKREPVWTGR